MDVSAIINYLASLVLSVILAVWSLARPTLATLSTANPDLASLAMLLVIFYVSLRIVTHTTSVMFNALRRMFTLAAVVSALGLAVAGIRWAWPGAITFNGQGLNLNFFGENNGFNSSMGVPGEIPLYWILRAYEKAQTAWTSINEQGLEPETLWAHLERLVNNQQ